MCIFGRRKKAPKVQAAAPAPVQMPSLPAPVMPRIIMQQAADPAIPAPNNAEASRQGAMEAQLRRRRRGAAAHVLTGPMGIPSGAASWLGAGA